MKYEPKKEICSFDSFGSFDYNVLTKLIIFLLRVLNNSGRSILNLLVKPNDLEKSLQFINILF